MKDNLEIHNNQNSRQSVFIIAVLILTLAGVMAFQVPARASSTDATTLASIGLSASTAETLGAATTVRSVKWIEVILSKQRLNAWQNGRIVMTSAISSGIRAYPTRRGTFKIYVKYRATRMRGPGYNLPNVPYTMYYSGNFGIHGAYWHNNFGHPMSHGCVNLPVAFARSLYLWAPMGTVVVIR
jgi:lipoprotein-anchoring transpeptidase ErfK/SrfK